MRCNIALLIFLTTFQTVECSKRALVESPRPLMDRVLIRNDNESNSTHLDLAELLITSNHQKSFSFELLYDPEYKETINKLSKTLAHQISGMVLHQCDDFLTNLRLRMDSVKPGTFLASFCSFPTVLDIFQKIKTELLESHLIHWVLVFSRKDFADESVVTLEDLVFEGTRVTLVQEERSGIYNVFEAKVSPGGDMHFFFAGSWDSTSRSKRQMSSTSNRKNKYWNMIGRQLTVAANDAPPYMQLSEQNPEGTYDPITGIDLSILNSLSKFMNFTYRVVSPPDGGWGYPEPDGSISGMIGMVARREVQLAVTGISVNEKRASVVGFSVPYSLDPLGIYSKAPREKITAFAILSPFTEQVWICLVITAIAIGPIMKIQARLSQIIGTEESTLRIHEYVFCMFRNLVIQGNPITANHWSKRLILFTWYLFCFIIYTLYAGLLTAVLAIPAYEKPVDSLQDLPQAVADGFTISVTRGTTNEYVFKEATGGILKQTWSLFNHKNRSKSFLPSSLAGMELVLKEKHIHICPRIVGQVFAGQMGRNRFHFGRDLFFPQFVGFALPPGAPYSSPMNVLIMRMSEAGLILKWKNEEIPKLSKKVENEKPKSNTITLVHLQAAFFIIVLGYTTAVIVFFMEKLLLFFIARGE